MQLTVEKMMSSKELSDEQIKYHIPLGALYEFNDKFCNHDSALMATAEAAFFSCTKALIEMGWTPPKEG